MKPPEAIMPPKVARIVLGGGRKVGLTQPFREAISSTISPASGTAMPSATALVRSPQLAMRAAVVACQEIFEKAVAQRQEVWRFPRLDRMARPRQPGLDHFREHRRALSQHRDAIGEEDRLVDIVRHEHGGEALLGPEIEDQRMEIEPRQRVD